MSALGCRHCVVSSSADFAAPTFVGPRSGPPLRPCFTPASDAAGSYLSPRQADNRAVTVDSVPRKSADILCVDWSGAAGRVSPLAELRATRVDDMSRRARSEPPTLTSTRIEVALAQESFGVVPDSGRRRLLAEPLVIPSKIESAKQAAEFGILDGLIAKKHFHAEPAPGTLLSPRMAGLKLQDVDIDSHAGRRHWLALAAQEDILLTGSSTWDFQEGASTQAARSKFFEQSMLADAYAAKLGRPRLKAQPLTDEWRQTAEKVYEHRLNGVRERGWRIVGSWHRTSSARAAPLKHQLLRNSMVAQGTLRTRTLEESDVNSSDGMCLAVGKKVYGGSAVSTASSSGDLHIADDISDGDSAWASPQPSPAWSCRSLSEFRKLSDIPESTCPSPRQTEESLPREWRRVLSSMVSGEAELSIATAAARALQRSQVDLRDESSMVDARHASCVPVSGPARVQFSAVPAPKVRWV